MGLTRTEISKLSIPQKINYYKNLNNEVTIATKNSKLGKYICGLSFPAGVTCRKDAPCRKDCYCSKGFQQTSSVLGTYLKNYRLWQKNPKDFFQQINYFLDHTNYKYMRIFDSGDIPNEQFLKDLTKVIRKHKDIKFLMFTKQYEIVNSVFSKNSRKPSNFAIVFSTWDSKWNSEVLKSSNQAKSFVDFRDKSRNLDIPKNAFECTGNCSKCFKCWDLKKNESVVFHQH